MSEQYYLDSDICDLFDISLSRLRARICEGKPLPPRIEVPGSRVRLWKKSIVHEWLEQHTVLDRAPNASIKRLRR